ncbi:MAG: hypothetical protein AAB466_09690 [Verrucomicrobiota bacterium]
MRRTQRGGECRLRNLWGEGGVMLCRDGGKPDKMNGSLLKFSTAKGESVVVVRAGTTPNQFKRTVVAETSR